jgi:hypothetical protein
MNDSYYIWYGAQTPFSEDEIKADIIAQIKLLSGTNQTVEFLGFSGLTPNKLTGPAEAIRNGFYDGLNGLQGYRNTWYTGMMFDEAGTSSLWNFTRQLVPRIVTALDN